MKRAELDAIEAQLNIESDQSPIDLSPIQHDNPDTKPLELKSDSSKWQFQAIQDSSSQALGGVTSQSSSVQTTPDVVSGLTGKLSNVDFSKMDSGRLGKGYVLKFNDYNGCCTSGPETWLRLMGYDVRKHKGWWDTPYSNNTTCANFIKNDPKHWKLVYHSDASGADGFSGVQPGDLALSFATHKDGKPTSHAQMWTGKDWRSDAIQRRAWVYGNRPGRTGDMSFQVWRYVEDPKKSKQGGIISAASGTSIDFLEGDDNSEYFNWSKRSDKYDQLRQNLKSELSEREAQLTKLASNPITFDDPKKVDSDSSSSKKSDSSSSKWTFTPIGDSSSTSSGNATSSTGSVTLIDDSNCTLKLKGTNANRDKLISELKGFGLDNDTAMALAAQAGGESLYKHTALNPRGKAYGLGQWMPAYHGKVLGMINSHFGTNHTSMSLTSFEEQAYALKAWYYDNNKSYVDSQSGAYNKAKMFAKIGLGPAIVKQGRYKNYNDTEEGWTRYITDTGNNPSGRSFTAQIQHRLNYAGFSYN